MTKKYELTEEHRAQLEPWSKKWISNAFSTKPMDEEEREICRKAVREMYQAANLTPPPDNRIVFVPSPFVLRFAGGFAAAIWHNRKKKPNDNTESMTHSATALATYSATYSATDLATRSATYSATASATALATYSATYSATDLATSSATRSATYSATSSATRSATDSATHSAIDSATHSAAHSATTRSDWYRFDIKQMKTISDLFGVGVFGIKCAQSAFSMWNGGNQWSGWVSFLSFFRHIVELKIDYSKWDCYEKLAIHSGPRIVHEEFCMISDRPKILKLNERNQGHCFDGPYCEWSDGSALYMFNGVRVPQWMAEMPANEFTKDMILKEKNADIRREMIRKIGIIRALEILDVTVIDIYESNVGGLYELVSIDMGDGRVRPFLKMKNPSMDNVYHVEGVRPEIKTVKEALMYRNNLNEFIEPGVIS